MKADSTHIVADQSSVAAFMASSAAYGGRLPVERIDTHAAMVFMVGERAYKIKRAVKFPYMDFSTLERRHRCCEREVALNRRTAPQLYRGVVPITRQPDGALALNGNGTVVEWAVVMRRFEQAGLFDRLATSHALTESMICAAADAAADFHTSAEILSGPAAAGGGHAGMRWVVDENIAELKERPELFPEDELAALAADTYARLAACRVLLDNRLNRGLVRRCHGDLHLRNICLIEGAPTIFDGIEFDDRLSCIDVLYDLAFLLMDLEHRELRAYGNAALNRYLERFGHMDGLAALPLFLSTRACVRAKVSASAGVSQQDAGARARREDEAKSYFRLAQSLLTLRPPRLIAIGGFSGSGKTSLAHRLAPTFGAPPGALHLRSDVIRKTLAGTGELTRLPQSAYSQAMTERVYAVLAEKAGTALAGGRAVIVDAVYLKPAERLFIEDVARRHAVPFCGLWLQAPTDTLLQRVSNRTGDASDATADIVREQMALPADDIRWQRIDTDRPLDTLSGQVRLFLQAGATGNDRAKAAGQ